MQYLPTTRQCLIFKAYLCFTAYAVAAQGEQIAHVDDLSQINLLTWVFILLLANIGWAVAELDQLVNVIYIDGRTAQAAAADRIRFLRSWLASNLAGVLTYFSAKSKPEWFGYESLEVPELYIFVAVAVAGYCGVRFIEAAKEKILGWLNVVKKEDRNAN